jgi:hypothetical protein
MPAACWQTNAARQLAVSNACLDELGDAVQAVQLFDPFAERVRPFAQCLLLIHLYHPYHPFHIALHCITAFPSLQYSVFPGENSPQSTDFLKP